MQTAARTSGVSFDLFEDVSQHSGISFQSAQRNFSATSKANTKTVNTGDLKVVAAVSWPHTLHFAAQGRFGGVVGGLSGRVPGCLSGTLSSSSFSFSFSSASLSGYGSGSCAFINKYLDQEDLGEGSRPQSMKPPMLRTSCSTRA